jgi:hypothetical protein
MSVPGGTNSRSLVILGGMTLHAARCRFSLLADGAQHDAPTRNVESRALVNRLRLTQNVSRGTLGPPYEAFPLFHVEQQTEVGGSDFDSSARRKEL